MIDLIHEISTTNHSKEQRHHMAQLLLAHPELMPELLAICGRVSEELSYRACWSLEFVCKTSLHALLPHLPIYIGLLPVVYLDAGVRPVAKICEYLTMAYYRQQDPQVRKALTAAMRQKITESCFDWLISDQKVAAKAYAMTALQLLGTEFDWIYPELQAILEQNYAAGSPAYQARARMTLQKIRKK